MQHAYGAVRSWQLPCHIRHDLSSRALLSSSGAPHTQTRTKNWRHKLAGVGCQCKRMRTRHTQTSQRWEQWKTQHTPFGWNTFVVKRTLGGLSGYWSQKVMRKLKMPPSHGVSDGPKMVAAHTKIFSSPSGAALAPCHPRQQRVSASAARCAPELQGLNNTEVRKWGEPAASPRGRPSAFLADHS